MPLRLNVLRGILDQASSERNTEARKRWAQAPFVLFPYQGGGEFRSPVLQVFAAARSYT
jgi:hypothetical protein